MKTKLLLVSFAAGLAGGFHSLPAQAPVAAPASTSSWTLTPAFVSQYMFRGTRLGGASFQPAAEYACGPLTLGLWTNFPVKSKVPGQSDPEIDPYGSYTFELAKDLTLQPGFTLYLYPDADKKNGFYKSTFEPSVALNYTVEGVKFTPKVYRDVVLEQTLWELSVLYSIPLKDVGTEIALLGTYGTFKATEAIENSTPATKNWGEYWLVGLTLPFQLSKDQKISFGWAYTEGRNNFLKQGSAPKSVNTGAVGRGVGTISYAFTF